MKKKIIAAALAACALVTACGCGEQSSAGSQPSDEYITDITVEESGTEEVSYSDYTRTYAQESLKSTLSAVIASAYGDSASSVSDKFSDSIARVVDNCEARGISGGNLLLVVDKLGAEKDALASLIAKEDGSSFAAARLFSDIAAIIGTDLACLVIYDCTLVYCDYYIDMYNGLYETYGYPYQLSRAGEWESRRAGFEAIGEDNCGYLLKTAVSAVSTWMTDADSVQSALSGVTAGEAATYIRAQGYMMQKLTLTSDDWNFLFEFSADSGRVQKMEAICAAGDNVALSSAFPRFVSDIAYALTQADSACAQAALDGDYSAFLKRLLSSWTSAQWDNFTALLEGLSGDYEDYFSKNDLLESYREFADGVSQVTSEDLVNSSEEEFYDNLKGYIASYSAQFAFVLFGL